MRKVLLAFSIAAISFVSAKAQDNGGFHAAGGLKVALPIGDFSNGYSLGIGAELQGEYMFAENISGVATAGYTHFLGKTVSEAGVDYKMDAAGFIPVLAGVRFYPSSQFFVGAKAGLSFGTQTGAGSSFTYEPQVGYNGEKFQVAAGYTAMSKNSVTLGSVGVSFLYKFN